MATNLSLRSLLDSDKLRGSNFNSWYQKLKIVLKYKRILYMLTDLTSEEPASNACGTVRDTYLKWLNDRIMVCCIMRATMNDEFSHKFEKAQPEKMLKVLNDSFGTLDDVKQYKTSCAIFHARMREGASVIDHILYMIEQIENLSKLSFSWHEQLGKDAILNFLQKSYLPFLSYYRVTKLIVNYYGLLGLLQTYEKDYQLYKETVNVMGASSSGRHRFFKKGKKKMKIKVPSVGGQIVKSKSKSNQSQAKCFYYRK